MSGPSEQQDTLAPGSRSGSPWPYSGKVLAERLVTDGVLTPEGVAAAIAEAAPSGRSLVEVIVTRGILAPEVMRDAMARIYGLALADLGENSIRPDAVLSIMPAFARHHLVLPIEQDAERFVLAVADPTRSRDLRDLQNALGRPLELRLAAPTELGKRISEIYSPRVTIRLGDGPKTTLVLPQGETRIGRAATNAIVIPDPSVSNVHALIRDSETGYQITDLGSRNGIFVNGERISGTRPLAHKDEIIIANATIKYRTVSPPDYKKEVDPEAAERKAKIEYKAEMIKSSGRILSQMVGAAALFVLILMLSGMIPSCGKAVAPTDEPSSSAPR